jgi:hypothetical protein
MKSVLTNEVGTDSNEVITNLNGINNENIEVSTDLIEVQLEINY